MSESAVKEAHYFSTLLGVAAIGTVMTVALSGELALGALLIGSTIAVMFIYGVFSATMIHCTQGLKSTSPTISGIGAILFVSLGLLLPGGLVLALECMSITATGAKTDGYGSQWVFVSVTGIFTYVASLSQANEIISKHSKKSLSLPCGEPPTTNLLRLSLLLYGQEVYEDLEQIWIDSTDERREALAKGDFQSARTATRSGRNDLLVAMVSLMPSRLARALNPWRPEL